MFFSCPTVGIPSTTLALYGNPGHLVQWLSFLGAKREV